MYGLSIVFHLFAEQVSFVSGMPSVRLPLYYRLLFPDLVEARNRSGLIDAPPKITQSAKIDQELYTYLALIVRDFIQPWYLAITLDNGLPSEVTRIVTHCCREVERRCQKVKNTKGTSSIVSEMAPPANQ